MMKFPEINIKLPAWVTDSSDNFEGNIPRPEDRMRFVIGLARQNIAHKTGGPFAAAVFNETGTLIVPGVNMVVSANCSVFHAEIVALALAQKILGRYDISDNGMLQYELVTAVEPCAMCFGAIIWSGIRGLVCGARDEDARSIGFDEGPKIKDWVDALDVRGIPVQRDVLRNEAVAVLREYADSGGFIYNAGLRMDPENVII
jgi:tRNA(Arg) A34 adenosine deaminase TadA